MIHIAIVENDPGERSRIRECFPYLEKAALLTVTADEFASGSSFISGYQPVYDIVLLDLDLPGIDGLSVARALRETDPSVLLILLADRPQSAMFGYEVDALDFLLKPISRTVLISKLKRAVSRILPSRDDFIQVRTDGEVLNLRISAIRYLEVTGHYVIFHSSEGNYREYCTLKVACDRLGTREPFVQPGRSYLVNLRYIDALRHDSMTIGEDTIPIARPQRKSFAAAVALWRSSRA